jgi:uncharacterized protein (DUF924 family)
MHIFRTRIRSDQNILDKAYKFKTIRPVLHYFAKYANRKWFKKNDNTEEQEKYVTLRMPYVVERTIQEMSKEKHIRTESHSARLILFTRQAPSIVKAQGNR